MRLDILNILNDIYIYYIIMMDNFLDCPFQMRLDILKILHNIYIYYLIMLDNFLDFPFQMILDTISIEVHDGLEVHLFVHI